MNIDLQEVSNEFEFKIRNDFKKITRPNKNDDTERKRKLALSKKSRVFGDGQKSIERMKRLIQKNKLLQERENLTNFESKNFLQTEPRQLENHDQNDKLES